MISRKATLRQPTRLFDPPNIAAAILSANALARAYTGAAILLVVSICALLPHIFPELSVNEFAAVIVAALGTLGAIAFLHSLRGRSQAVAAQGSVDEARAVTSSILGALDEAILLADM